MVSADPEMVAPTRLLVIQPDAAGPLEWFGSWFEEEGITYRTIELFDGADVPSELGEDGLVVLGGDMSSTDDHDYPWLEDIRALYRRANELERPSLGICLGAQLMSQAFGGSVRRGDRGVEAGVTRVRWRGEAKDDLLFHDLKDPFLAGSFHGDMIETLPPEAVWLASSTMYPHQAFRVGACSWAVQFHPEIGSSRFAYWVDVLHAHDDAATRDRLVQGKDDFVQMEAAVLAGSEAIARRFTMILNASARLRMSGPESG